MHRTLIFIGFRYDMTDNLQRLLWFVFFLIILYLLCCLCRTLHSTPFLCISSDVTFRYLNQNTFFLVSTSYLYF
jgi:hypothetical protein